jgi:putative ABC transport system ATP-binding protein
MILEAVDLEQRYQSGGQPLTVLKDINLAIEPEAFVAIVGPSGSGKTTLLGLLAGLDLPTRGVVRLDGQDLNELSEDGRAAVRAAKVGFVFQTFQLIPTLTALENVLVPIELRADRTRHEGRPAEQNARAWLERVGLGGRAHHYPTELSGGEQQRVALARAFAGEPKILLADEPTGSLDAETGKSVIDLLIDLNRDARTTLVLVTHDPALAARARRIVRLKAGKIVADEAAEAARPAARHAVPGPRDR